ncbi:hypothetical protein DFP72DRAFT_778657, partial [Ephemerocybe angulata]
HHLHIQPTENTLSFYVTFMARYINPRSITAYLSGICHQLEPYYPNVRALRLSSVVTRTLRGAHRRHGAPFKRKMPITVQHLTDIANQLPHPRTHDNILFLTLLYSGFFGLLRLGELTAANEHELRNPRKVIARSSVKSTESWYEFALPAQKTDPFFEGNRILIRANTTDPNPYPIFFNYLHSRDHLFPYHSPLFLTSNGAVPKREWFLSRLRRFLPPEFAGQSLRSGGATWLAAVGMPPNLIQ